MNDTNSYELELAQWLTENQLTARQIDEMLIELSAKADKEWRNAGYSDADIKDLCKVLDESARS